MQSRKPIFFTSDWHIGHANVINFSNRPFKSVEHMEEVLVNNFNADVPEGSVTYFLGDMGLCSSQMLSNTISKLKGTKVLILGNHDKKPNAMYSMGFDVVLYGAKLVIANQIVTLSHCPLLGLYRENTDNMLGAKNGENWHGEFRPSAARFSTPNFNQFHLHGHIHSPNGGKSTKTYLKQFDVGVDANNYRPVSISKIESWISTYKED